MDKELKDKWVAALRSGDYEQGMGFLRDRKNQYCCLGVLLDTCGEGQWVEKMTHYSYATGLNEQPMELPRGFAESAGIRPDQEVDLINKNDSERASFGEIADWIEANL